MRRLLGAACAVALSACALVRHPDAPRFFDPEPAARELAPAEPATPPVKVPVRLGPVRSSSYRRDRIVWRASEVELGLFDDVVAPTREAYVAIFVTLVAPDQRQLLAREFTARSPIADRDPASVARAM